MLDGIYGYASYGPAVYIYNNTLYAAYNNENWALELTPTSSISPGWTLFNDQFPDNVFGPNAVITVGDRIFFFGVMRSIDGSSKDVMSWRPGTSEPWQYVSDMNVARNPDRLCSSSDGLDRIWVMAGCRDCVQTGFMEMYQISTDRWTRINTLPNYTELDLQDRETRAEICGYYDNYIYAILGLSDRRFHIFNIIRNTWNMSKTGVRQRRAAFVVV